MDRSSPQETGDDVIVPPSLSSDTEDETIKDKGGSSDPDPGAMLLGDLEDQKIEDEITIDLDEEVLEDGVKDDLQLDVGLKEETKDAGSKENVEDIPDGPKLEDDDLKCESEVGGSKEDVKDLKNEVGVVGLKEEVKLDDDHALSPISEEPHQVVEVVDDDETIDITANTPILTEDKDLLKKIEEMETQLSMSRGEIELFKQKLSNLETNEEFKNWKNRSADSYVIEEKNKELSERIIEQGKLLEGSKLQQDVLNNKIVELKDQELKTVEEMRQKQEELERLRSQVAELSTTVTQLSQNLANSAANGNGDSLQQKPDHASSSTSLNKSAQVSKSRFCIVL
uniref:digestive organ expansion factor homolog isoform X2 n=1 Tax=Ciona intestinalis TaxID=7719 RepID=UPI000EF45A58|nr:digestive organ expansion factor homolog isoform X2 [Ciona intestinalis]|eukprot:XP_026693832.1 digestive organ expansion factor homolog isoform X2 [Ciona intestinalis]